MKSLRLAVDTNVLLDFVEGVDAVLDSFALIDQRFPEPDILIVPSVLEELASLRDTAETSRVRRAAVRAIDVTRQQAKFRPLLELANPPEDIRKTNTNTNGHKNGPLPPLAKT